MQASSVRQSSHPLSFRLISIFTVAIIVALIAPACLFAQVSGSISGTVQDSTGAAVPGAKVGLVDEASQEARSSVSNGSGYFTFSGITPGTYTVTAETKGFKSWKAAGIVMHPGDVRTLSNLQLEVGTASEVVEVLAEAAQAVPIDSGAREDVLSERYIHDLPMESRNVSEWVKVLAGVNNQTGTANGAGYINFLDAGVTGSTVGVGLSVNGAAYRGGTSYLSDGANIIDPGCNCWSTATVEPRMTQEVQIQTSNFGADVAKGPTVINSVGKSGTKDYHGSLWFDARNDVLNANDWVNNNAGNPRGKAHMYYPGGDFGGPVPFTGKKVFFWFGYDHFLQNLGNSNTLTSYIPSSGMLGVPGTTPAVFNSSDPGVAALCPNLNGNGDNTDTTSNHAGTACASVNGMVLPDGTPVSGGIIPAQYLDPGAAALEKVWPAANTDPTLASNGGNNYRQNFPHVHDGYIYRMRFDYDLNDSNKFFVSYQYGTDSQLTSGTGAHVWYNPGNIIPFPGGGLQSLSQSKTATGHFVHVFSASATNEFIAAWGWVNGPTTAGLTQVSISHTGYPYANAFHNTSVQMIPSWNGTSFAFPDFSQADLFDAGAWLSKKQTPSFADNFTKVWRTHTIKLGGYYENTGNIQSSFSGSQYANGVFSFGGSSAGQGANPDYLNVITGTGYQGAIGSASNPTADFVTGIASFYGQASSAPYQDMAYRTLSGYIDDSWKVSKRLTVQWGFRFDHMGRWFDRSPANVGMAAFYPDLVTTDEAVGKRDPGLRWHGIDPGVPISGSPVRAVFVAPRFGLAYDLFGTGKTVLRGGWGRYRWNDQVNDYLGTLQTAQPVLNFSSQSGFNVLESDVPNLPVPSLSTPFPYSTPAAAPNGQIYATDPTDYEIPYTDSYNFTISQEFKWKTIAQIAYVGSSSSKLLMGGQNIGFSTGGDLINRNKMPLGALFAADPLTGLKAADPEHPGNTCGTVGGSAYCNTNADYQPFGVAYGSNAVYVPEHEGYSNYNSLQLSWAKPTGSLSYTLNYTWSKALGTSLGTNPYSVGGNYGILDIDRPHVINTAWSYRVPAYSLGESRFVRAALRDWAIGGFFTWQSGTNMAAPNNVGADLALNLTYADGSPLGAPTYFGTTAQMHIMPVVTCNPTSGLGTHQVAKLDCFGVPAVGSNGPRSVPYISGPSFWDTDLSIGRTVHITERQTLEFRALAINWLNHPLRSFSGINNGITNQLKLYFTKDPATGIASSSSHANGTWGTEDTKVGQPNQRIVMLTAAYRF